MGLQLFHMLYEEELAFHRTTIKLHIDIRFDSLQILFLTTFIQYHLKKLSTKETVYNNTIYTYIQYVIVTYSF
jgi:hypothetical protein